MTTPETPKTETEPFALTQIPANSLFRLGVIFKEGEAKYGRHNWRSGVGDLTYQRERANHALKHLLLYVSALEHDEALYDHEDHLAKVMWFCATQMELERLAIGDAPDVNEPTTDHDIIIDDGPHLNNKRGDIFVQPQAIFRQ